MSIYIGVEVWLRIGDIDMEHSLVTFCISILATALVNHILSVNYADDLEDDSDKTSLMETNLCGYLVV